MPEKQNQLQVVVLAAGKGTRMNSELPKVLHRLCGQTIIERVLTAVLGLAPSSILVVVGYQADLVEAELGRLSQKEAFSSTSISTVLQSEQRGTGHAAQVALEKLGDGEVLILPGDMPLVRTSELEQLCRAKREAAAELAFLTAIHPEPAQFGRILRSDSGELCEIVEAADCSPEQLEIQEINTSTYLADKAFLAESLAKLESKNAQGELYLTDIVSSGLAEARKVCAVSSGAYLHLSGANSVSELSALEQIRRREIVEELMDSGVSFEDPERVYIDESVDIARGCFIGSGTRLQGETKIAADVEIEGDSLIRDSEIGAGTRIHLASWIVESEVGPQCAVGPFARLRPGTKLGEDVRVGNFVETKNAILKEGVRAGHLTYLGDAEVGERVNIGAGTITCNYDGSKKHKTTIGQDSFIGSNSCLVAPIEVSSSAYVGAGSTITKRVPSGSLGLGRAKQRNVEGWMAKKKS